jgi:ankyrin repeat protein
MGNTLPHIAAIHGNDKLLAYIVTLDKINIFERNNEGETALSIAQSKKNTKAIEILETHAQKNDHTKLKTDELLNDLLQEENKQELLKQKKKEKKKRAKIRQLAEKEGVTYAEMET